MKNKNSEVNQNTGHEHFSSYQLLEPRRRNIRSTRILLLILIGIIGLLFVPWTQNVESTGAIIALQPDERPQSVQTIIAGRIEKWYVQEGDSVKAGDTILFLSEVKVDYFDPNLLNNTEDQLHAKESSVGGYMQKITSLDAQIDAMIVGKDVKKEQTRTKIDQTLLKIKTDSLDYVNASRNSSIAREQFQRYESLYQQNLISLTELENRRVNMQNLSTKEFEIQNKLLISRNELNNLRRELRSIDAEYADKISKAESEKFATISSMYQAEAEVTKLQNTYSNYDRRNGFYYITAPRDGFLSKTTKSGIGETVKEGEEIAKISPYKFDKAVEIFVSPTDIPLIHPGEQARIIFDGYPAFVISGWQNISKGVYNGTILSVDPALHESGKYRVLIQPNADNDWPEALRLGGGVNCILLLNDVPLGYEIWRKMNGFPVDFYSPQDAKQQKNENK